MANVSWSTSIQVAGGPTVTATEGPFVAEAIDRIDVTIPANTNNKEVDLQPSDSKSIHLLLIKSSRYGEDIKFKASGDGTEAGGGGGGDDTETGDDGVLLTGPQLYSKGTISLLHEKPKKLKFTNPTATDIQIEIFVARDATPSETS